MRPHRAPTSALRARVDVFAPLTPALARLTRGVKASFDPRGLFNPGRMYADRSDADPFHRRPARRSAYRESLEKILRSCVHCGFCTATCPTYVVGGDERDSPRGRIYLIKELLETGRAPTRTTSSRSTIACRASPA